MAAEGELFEDADPLVLADSAGRGGTNDRLHVQAVERCRVPDGEVPALATDLQFTLPHAVTPLGVQIAEAGHLELEERFEPDRRGLADPWCHRQLEPLGRSSAGPPGDLVVDGSHRFGRWCDLGSGDRRDEAGLVPAFAVEQFVDVEVGREGVEIEWRPQPEELRVGNRSAGGRALTHTTDTPRAVAAAECFAGGQVVQHAVDLDPTLPPAELGETGVVERDP